MFFFNQKLILYSNQRDNRFIPIYFHLNYNEKKYLSKFYLKHNFNFDKKLLSNHFLLEANKKSSFTSIYRGTFDVNTYTADSLNKIQCFIIFSLIKNKNIENLFKELPLMNSKFNNRFLILLNLNYLIKFKIITKKNNNYHLLISKGTINKICEKIGFKNVFQ